MKAAMSTAVKCGVLALAMASMSLASGATRADVITFAGLPEAVFTGPFTEGNFTYNTSSGGLRSSDVFGNPAPDMAGLGSGSNILRIVRNGGGLFTFDGADVAQADLGIGVAIRFRGILNGILQDFADLMTTATSLDFAGGSQGSGALSGVAIDELLVELDDPNPGIEAVDNIRLTPVEDGRVPAPATLALLGLGLLGLGWNRHRK